MWLGLLFVFVSAVIAGAYQASACPPLRELVS